jgi:LysM repeat protein
MVNIKAIATVLCLAALIACSAKKEEPASSAITAAESDITQVEQGTKDQSDVIELNPISEVVDRVLNTHAGLSDETEPGVLGDYESEKNEVSIKPKTDSIKVKTVTEDKVASESVMETEASAKYTIKQGDTLAAVANSHHVTVAAIVATNDLADPNSIQVGQQLVLE